MSSEGTRINKYLSEIGYCSRRQADKLIEQGRILVNSKEAVMGHKFKRMMSSMLMEKKLRKRKQKEFLLLLTNLKVWYVQQMLELKKITSLIL